MLPRFLRSALDSAPPLPLLPLPSFSFSDPLSFSLCFSLCHSSSLPSYLTFATFLTLSFSLFSPLSFISLFSFLFASQPFIYLFHSTHFAIIYNISLSFSLSLLFISVALIILLPSWRFRKSSLYLLPYDRFRRIRVFRRS